MICIRPVFLLLLVSLTTPALAQFFQDDPLSSYRHGGKFHRFDPVISEYNQTGKPLRLDGSCASACTMFLSVKHACVVRTATFLFHAGRDRNRMQSAQASGHMLRTYRAGLRKFLIANHYMDTLALQPISGSDMIEKFGYRECPKQG